MLRDVHGRLAGARHARGCHRPGDGGAVDLDMFEDWPKVEVGEFAFAVREGDGGHTPVAGSGEGADVVKAGRGICGERGGRLTGGVGIRGGVRGEVVRGREREARVIAVGASGSWNGLGGKAVM